MEASDLVTLSSSRKDLHGDLISSEQLQEMARQLNGPLKVRLLVAHRRDIPPYGHWGGAQVVEENGLHVLKARQIFHKPAIAFQGFPGMLIAELPTPQEFAILPSPRTPTVIIDKNNYRTGDVAVALAELIEKEFPGMAVEMEARKDFHLATQISIILSDYWHQIHPLVEALGVKAVDVVLEENIGEGYKLLKKKLYGKIRNLIGIVRLTRKNVIPQDQPQIVIFEIPGTPLIHLYSRTNDLDLIATALQPKKLAKVHARIRELNKVLQVNEAHFKLDKDGNWKFNYVITEKGQIVGTKDTMTQLNKQVERIKLEGWKSFSLGARVKYEKRPLPPADEDRPL